MLDPLLQMCSLSASRLNPCDMATYLINCLYAMHSTLALYEFTDQRLEMLAAQIAAHQDTLVNEQASYVLSMVSLIQVYSITQQHKPHEVCTSQPDHLLSMVFSCIRNKELYDVII